MKRFITFLTIMCLPAMAVGGALTSVVNYAEQEKKNIEIRKKNLEIERKLDKVIDQEVINAIAKRLAQSFPDHVEELSKLIDEKKEEFEKAGDSKYTGNIYSGFTKFFMLLSRKVFNEIKERELDRIEKYGQSRGRKIKKDVSITANKYDDNMIWMWLDRGKLESEACQPKMWSNCGEKNETFECYAKEAQKWCDYPIGFEDYIIYIQDGDGFSSISSTWDDKSKNQTRTVSVKWWHSGDKNWQDTDFSYYEHLSNYAEVAEWRNRNRKAMRDGIYLKSTYCGWEDTKTDPKCKDIVDKELADFYPNGNDGQPAVSITGNVFTNTSHIDKTDIEDELDPAKKYLLDKEKKR